MKIYRISIVNHGWEDNTYFLERHYNSISMPNIMKDKFEKIKQKFLSYYKEKTKNHKYDFDDLSLWAHYNDRKEFLSSSCHIEEIEVIDTMFYYGKPVSNLTKKQREEYLKLGYTLQWKNS